MKLKKSNISSPSIESNLSELFKNSYKSTSLKKLEKSNISTIEDLLWVLPKNIIKLPTTKSFSYIKEGSYFRGKGKIISIQARPNYSFRGKGRTILYNISATVLDSFVSNEKNNPPLFITLKWFNCYQSIKKKITTLPEIIFIGITTQFNQQVQIINPDFNSPDNYILEKHFKIQYPTIKGVKPLNIQQIINRIPSDLWDSIPENLPVEILKKYSFPSRSNAFKYLHAKKRPEEWDAQKLEKSKERLIYEEFYIDQVKIYFRRKNRDTLKGIQLNIDHHTLEEAKSFFHYQLTSDQKSSLLDIQNDLKKTSPMLRLIQGDVGSGKTTIALISCYLIMKNNFQAAFMCPTESLALQQYDEANKLFSKNYKVSLLIGSTNAKERQLILEEIKSGKINLIVGTHSLFQNDVHFKNLGLAIIDEQHKFGVNQRIKLLSKGESTHSLIMSATPIPRSLGLTQYGDLDISVINSMPSGRKGHQTRIIKPKDFNKFLNFIQTRIEMGEQAYIVVPAINESDNKNIKDLYMVWEKFKFFFPSKKIEFIHGKMKSSEKVQVFDKFKNKEINILIATSVIEVGINVVNATIMGIFNPERFGLSSLHQIRGRVGRGDRPGFCFLIIEENISKESLNRLKIIKNNNDGFKIAEEDLKIRGEGDLFGADQSGNFIQKKIANLISHKQIFAHVIEDFKSLRSEKKEEDFYYLHQQFESDQRILSTI